VNFSSKYSSLSAQDLDYQQHPFIFHHNQMKQNHQSISLDNLDSPPKLSFTIKLSKLISLLKGHQFFSSSLSNRKVIDSRKRKIGDDRGPIL